MATTDPKLCVNTHTTGTSTHLEHDVEEHMQGHGRVAQPFGLLRPAHGQRQPHQAQYGNQYGSRLHVQQDDVRLVTVLGHNGRTPQSPADDDPQRVFGVYFPCGDDAVEDDTERHLRLRRLEHGTGISPYWGRGGVEVVQHLVYPYRVTSDSLVLCSECTSPYRRSCTVTRFASPNLVCCPLGRHWFVGV